MLVLSRRKDERIMIDGRISIKVVDVRGNTVRLGIEAPRTIPVHREELLTGHKAGAHPLPNETLSPGNCNVESGTAGGAV